MTDNEVESINILIFDLNWRLIQTKRFNNFGFEKRLNLENLAVGMYFLKMEGVKINTVKRILKE